MRAPFVALSLGGAILAILGALVALGQQTDASSDGSAQPPPNPLDAVPDNGSAPDIRLLGLLEELSPRELFWWRTIRQRVEMHHPDPECLVGIEYVGEIPVLVFTQHFFVLERQAGIVALKTVLAKTEESCTLT